jgi:hypothetical protein
MVSPEEILWATPEELSPGLIEETTTLILGAPYLGKSWHVERQLGGAPGLSLTRDLPAGKSEDASTETIIIDEFYRAYQRASEETRVAFGERLSEDGDLCVVARPRAFDWLLDSPDHSLSEDVLDAFDRIVNLGYDRRDDDEVRIAIDRCREIGTDSDKDDSGGVSEADLRANLDKLCYEYEFQSAALSEAAHKYPETVVPPLVGYLPNRICMASIPPRPVGRRNSDRPLGRILLAVSPCAVTPPRHRGLAPVAGRGRPVANGSL